MPNFLETRGLKSQDIVMDAQLIKAVPINDTDKGDEKVLAYNQPTDKIQYIPRCPEIVIKAIQHVSIVIANGETSVQILINEVDLDNTFLIFGGAQAFSSYLRRAVARIELIDSTHIRAMRAGTGVVYYASVCVVECTAGIKSIQRRTITLTGELDHDATIDEVDTDKTFVSHLSVECDGDALYRALTRIYLLNSTTVRANCSECDVPAIVSYEVVEFI